METWVEGDVPEGMPALEEMCERVEGACTRPGDAEYDAARTVWNGMIDRYPLVVVRAASVDDVDPVLDAVRRTGLPLAVRGGGHNIAGLGTVDDGIVLDLGGLRDVHVDPDSHLVTVAPGARTADVDAATVPHRLAVPLGTASGAGVAGQTLGGGVGWLVRSAGLALDRLVSAEVITADGTHRTASATEEPELFWGLRGGGGNFGVVTSFTFRAVTLPDPVLGVSFSYSTPRWRRALAAFERWSRNLPDEVTTILTFLRPPAGAEDEDETRLLIRSVYVGENQELGRLVLERLRRAAPPEEETSGPINWLRWQSAMDHLHPDGTRGFWRNVAFSAMDEDALDVIHDIACAIPAPGTGVDIRHLGGAFARVPEDSVAFPRRSARFWMTIHGAWQEQEEDDRRQVFAERSRAAMRRLGESGEYVNFRAREYTRPVTDFSRAIYGERTYRRLQQVKRTYDPENMFRENYNVAP